MINNLPQPIIQIILSLLPTKEAVRTSILSTEWKYHWTTIPKLVFIEDALKISRDDDGLKQQLSIEKHKLLNQVISMHQGPIHEFSLSIHRKGPRVEIDHIIHTLSRNNNTLTKLTLDMCGYLPLPESLFSLHNLTHLYLHCCRLDVQPTLNGFGGSLTYLYIGNVVIAKRTLILLLSNCPLLKILTLNAKVRSLPTIDDFTLTDLFGCFPMIENLSICLTMMTDFAQGRVPYRLPIALVELKCLCIRDTRPPHQEDRISCLLLLMRSCPNLEKLKLKIYGNLFFNTWTNHSGMWFAHLSELEIEFWGKRPFTVMNLLPHILAKSPVLRKVKILLRYKVSKDEELNILRRYKGGRYKAYAHASPVVEIIVESGVRSMSDRF